jgi:hypothetical protein
MVRDVVISAVTRVIAVIVEEILAGKPPLRL